MPLVMLGGGVPLLCPACGDRCRGRSGKGLCNGFRPCRLARALPCRSRSRLWRSPIGPRSCRPSPPSFRWRCSAWSAFSSTPAAWKSRPARKSMPTPSCEPRALPMLLVGGLGGAPGFHRPVDDASRQPHGREGRSVGIATAVMLALMLPFAGQLAGAMPTFVAAGLMIALGVELIRDWLWQSRRQLPLIEWLVVLAIPLGMIAFGFIGGMALWGSACRSSPSSTTTPASRSFGSTRPCANARAASTVRRRRTA